MGLLDKIPFPRTQREFFERLLSPTEGHRHDGVDSRKVPLDAALIEPESIATGKIADGAVTSAKIDPQGVGTGQLANNAVTSDKIFPQAVGSAALEDESVGFGKLHEDVLRGTSVVIEAAEFKTLNTVPVELVPEPGAGKMIDLVRAVLFLDYGDEAFTGAHDLIIGLDDGSVPVAPNIDDGDFPLKAADHIYVVQPLLGFDDVAANVLDKNLAITAENDYGGDTSNNNVVTVIVDYRILTLV